MSKKPLDRIKTSVTSRGLSIAKLGFEFGAKAAGRGLAQIFESKTTSDHKWKNLLVEQAKNFSTEVGELKGSLMKAGQMLSMYGEHFFPPEINQFLKTLQQDSPAVKWENIEAILQKELSAELLNELFIEQTPVGTASIGQVHRAVIKDTGQRIALKIQYPGVDQAIDTDLAALKTFINFSKLLPKDIRLEPVFDEIKEMLHQETDYRAEAEWTKKYKSLIQDDSRYVVPTIYDKYCTDRVIASSFESGLRIDDPLVQSLPQKRRDEIAESFLELYFKELFLWGTVQTDPHAGNYRLRLSPTGFDQLILFDFGATRQYSEDFMKSYRKMIKFNILRQREPFLEASKELGFVKDGDDPALTQLFEDFCNMITEPFMQDHYDWKGSDLPQRTTKKVLEIIKGYKWRTPPKEILFLDRKTGGVFIMMSQLGAKISGRQVMNKYF